MPYLPSQYFTFAFTFSDRTEIGDKYDAVEWAHVYTQHLGGHKISHNAIKMCARLKKDLNIEVFPLIISTAIKGWSSGGQAIFKMIMKDQRELYFYDRIQNCLAKKNTLIDAPYFGSSPGIDTQKSK